MCVIDQAVAGAFTQFVFPGGQCPLVAAHTEKVIENRTIRRKVRFIDSSTNQKNSAPAAMKFFSLITKTWLSWHGW